MRVFYFEEAAWADDVAPQLETRLTAEGVIVAHPLLPNGLEWSAYDDTVRGLIAELLARYRIRAPIVWFYTPHALAVARDVHARLTVYDCMDELSAFQDADPELPALESALMARADLVFTGGRSLFEAKRTRHPAVHCFPSGVDLAHFTPARAGLPEPAVQAAIADPKVGFYGVLDERLDCDLLGAVAALRPSVQFVLIGPVAKIEQSALPVRSNIHYLGEQAYADLPAFVSHWGAALMPFAICAATRFISPTKTPEYLAAGRPVVSAPIAGRGAAVWRDARRVHRRQRRGIRGRGGFGAGYVAQRAGLAAGGRRGARVDVVGCDLDGDARADRRGVAACAGRDAPGASMTSSSSARASPDRSWRSVWPRHRASACW